MLLSKEMINGYLGGETLKQWCWDGKGKAQDFDLKNCGF
jgi:hypothetical protein